MSSDHIYTVKNGRYYEGRSTMSSDELKKLSPGGFQIKDEKVYEGRSTMSSSQVASIKGDKIYKGRSTMSSDQIATIKGDRLSDDELYTVIFLLLQRNHLI